MRVLYGSKRQVISLAKNRIKVIDVAVQGPAAIPPTVYMDHMVRTDNPHEVSLFQLKVPRYKEGQWIRFSDDGQSLIIVNPPLTEMPDLPIPPDECVRADPDDPVTGYLNGKVAGLVIVDEAIHVIRLKGVITENLPANVYYGTNDTGQLGFWPLPPSLIQVSGIGMGIGAENEEEWLNNGAVGLFYL